MKIPAFAKLPVLFVAAVAIIEMFNGGHYTQRIISGGSTPEPPKFPLRHFSPPASASKGLFGERK